MEKETVNIEEGGTKVRKRSEKSDNKSIPKQ